MSIIIQKLAVRFNLRQALLLKSLLLLCLIAMSTACQKNATTTSFDQTLLQQKRLINNVAPLSSSPFTIASGASSTTNTSGFAVSSGSPVSNSPFAVSGSSISTGGNASTGASVTSGASTQTKNPQTAGTPNCGSIATDFCFQQNLASSISITMKNIGGASGFLNDQGNTSIQVLVFSGAGQPSFQWFKNGSPIKTDNKFFFVSDGSLQINAQDYSVLGNYNVQVTDPHGTKITSNTIQVKIIEDNVGCAAGSYIASAVDPITSFSGLQSRFNNSGGKWMLNVGYLDGYPINFATSDYRIYTVSAIASGQPAPGLIACNRYLPNINTDPHTVDFPSCQFGYDWTNGYTCNIPPGHFTGSMDFVCENNKLLLTSNTCKFVIDPPVTVAPF